MTGLYDTLPVFAQNLACTWAGYRRARGRFTPHFDRCLREWEQTGSESLETLHEIQWTRLRVLVERARRSVPHYRDMQLPPVQAMRDPAEAIQLTLGRIPPLDKSTYRETPERFIAEDIHPRRLKKTKTGGTTGSPLPLWYTNEALAEEYATVWRLRRACGIDLWDPHFTFGGQTIVPFEQARPPFWRRNAWGHQILFSLYHMNASNLEHYVRAIHEIPTSYAQGYPSSLHLLARAMLSAGRPLPAGRLAAIFTSSESLLSFQREDIERAFGAPVWDRYGTSEFCISMTACSEKRLHVDMEFCIVEVEAEEETESYVRGPLLATGLGNDATPFLRYRVGDVGTRSKTPCPCGRPGDVFLDVDGRIEDYVMTPDGRLVGRLDHIFKDQHDVGEAQILQERKEAIEVRVVPRAGWGPESERSLMSEIRSRLGSELAVEIVLVDEIEREPNGKFRAVKSRIGRIAP